MRRLLLAAVVAGLPLVAAACTSQGPPSCDAPEQTTTVDMKDSRFAAACIQADAGATLSVVNSDGIPHTYTVEDTEVNVVLEGNETAQASLAGIAPGTYAVVCTYHPGMKAALQVR